MRRNEQNKKRNKRIKILNATNKESLCKPNTLDKNGDKNGHTQILLFTIDGALHLHSAIEHFLTRGQLLHKSNFRLRGGSVFL